MQIKRLVEKLANTSSVPVCNAIETSIEEKEAQRQQLDKELTQKQNRDYNFETALEKVTTFISKPHNMWINGDLEQKQKVQKLIFLEPLTFDISTVFGTAKKALPYLYFSENDTSKSYLVEVSGIEPLSKKVFC